MSGDDRGKPVVGHVDAAKAVVAGSMHFAGGLNLGPVTQPGDKTNFPAAGIARNKQFVGRVGELKDLHQRLARGPVAVFHAVTSDGGFGKSQLAVEYAFRHRRHYAGTWFIDASSASAEDRDGRSVLTALGVDVPQESDAVAARVAQALSRDRHLLILDDVRDLAAALKRYALANPARLLVTTRARVVAGEGFDPFPLEVLARADAIELLAQGRADLKDPQHRPALDAVAACLHDHALAIALAGGYLRRWPDKFPPDLLEKLEAQPIGGDRDLLDGIDPASAAAGYRRGVAATLLLHLPTLGAPTDDADRLAQLLLAAASLVDPRAIPPELLLSATEEGGDNPTPHPYAEAALQTLLDVSVLRYGEGADAALLNIHGLTQQLVRAKLGRTEEGKALLGRAADGLRETLLAAFSSEALRRPAYWPGLDRISPHAEALLAMNPPRPVVAAWGDLSNKVGSFVQNSRHRLDDARSLYGQAERVYRQCYGDNHPSVAREISNIGRVLHESGDLDGAMEMLVQAERIVRSFYGDAHPTVATTLNNIGGILQDRGDFDGAITMFLQAERIDRQVFGDCHHSVANVVNNIGLALQNRGDLEAALERLEEAERVSRVLYGDDHPAVATAVNNVGRVLHDRGDLERALAKYEEAERIDRAAYGGDHPLVAIRINNIGGVFRDRGDLDQALTKFADAERIYRAAYGAGHPRVAIAVGNVGHVLRDRGDLRGALTKFAEAFDMALQALGPRGKHVVVMARSLLAVGADPVERARQIAGDAVAEALRAAMAERDARREAEG